MVMSELQALIEQNRFSEVADLLERSDSPLDSRNEDLDLWLLLVLGHVMNHRCPHARFACKRAPVGVTQNEEFKLAHEVVKYVWNREYSDVWSILKCSTWQPERAAFLGAVSSALREKVAASIGSAYSVISIKAACEMLGLTQEELISDCQDRPNWTVDAQSGFVRIQQHKNKASSAVELAELDRITDHMIALA